MRPGLICPELDDQFSAWPRCWWLIASRGFPFRRMQIALLAVYPLLGAVCGTSDFRRLRRKFEPRNIDARELQITSTAPIGMIRSHHGAFDRFGKRASMLHRKRDETL
jgi:hypothetical protein